MKRTLFCLLFLGIFMALFGSTLTVNASNHVPQIILTAPLSQEGEIVTDLYVWRHGETEANVAEVLSGGGDTKATLTATGQQQAKGLADKITRKGFKLQAIYSSDLPRAMQTAAAVLAIFPPEKISSIISAPQLREILHGKYERIPAEARAKKVAVLFKNELDRIESNHKCIQEGIAAGTLDRFHFWKIHPMDGHVVGNDAPIIHVNAYFSNNCQEAETAYELYQRVYAEFVRIAKESQKLGFNEIGVSTHGAVLSSLINAANYGHKNVFVPLFYQPSAIQRQGEVVMPATAKVGNCALTHFRYWHKSQQLEFCGIVE